MRFLARLCFLLVAVFFNLAVASADQQTPTSLPEKITIQLKWKHQFQFAGYYAAKEKGFYAEEGLDVTLRPRAATENQVEEVVQGRAEYGVSDSGLLLAREQGKPVVLLKQIFQHSPLVFVAKKESGIVSPYEMVGKKVRFNPASENFASLTALLIETIGGPSRVVTVPQSYDLGPFVRGDVDVISAYRTDLLRLEATVGAYNVIDPLSYGVDFYGDNLFTTDEEIRSHPGRAEKVARATIRGWRYALEHKKEIVDIILAKYAPDSDREALLYEAHVTEQMILPEVVELGAFNPLRYRRIAGMFAQVGLSASPAVPEGFFYHDRTAKKDVAEQVWLAEHPTIRAGVVLHGAPLAFLGKNGDVLGAEAEFVKRLENVLGVQFLIVPGTRKELAGKLRDGEIDLISNVTGVAGFQNGSSLLQTASYADLTIGIFAAKGVNFIGDFDLLDGRKVAVLENSRFRDVLRKRYPKIDVITVANIGGGLDLVNAGDVFAYVGETLTTYHVIQHRGYETIHMVGEAPFAAVATMAVTPDSQTLQGILQKGIDGIGPQDRKGIYDEWAPLVREMPPDYSWVWKIVGGLVLASLLLFLWNMSLSRQVKRRTASLAASEEMFRKLFEEHSAVKFIVDPDTGAIVDANKAAAEYLGWPREELRRMSILDINAQSPDAVRKGMADASAGTGQHFELRYRLADGSVRDVDVFAGGITHQGRNLLHTVVHDITERKEAEKALIARTAELRRELQLRKAVEERERESNKHFQATFEQAAVGIAHVAPDGHLLRVNERFCEICGRPREDMLRLTFRDITHPDDLERDVVQVSRLLAGEVDTYTMEKRNLRPDGEVVWVSLTVSLLRDTNGQPDYFVGVIEDITERKALESQLRQSQKMEAVGQLTGGLAHDLNNVLSVISMNVELLSIHAGVDPSMVRHVETALKGVRRASEMTRKLLDFSRTETGETRRVSLPDFVRGMENMIAKSLTPLIALEINQADDVWPVDVNPGDFEAALLNLSLNARDAMPKGGSLAIETSNKVIDEAYVRRNPGSSAGEFVTIAVSDTGVGMAPDVVARAFEPFFTTKEVGKGTGLGLSMVYGFVRRSGGHAKIYSEPGSGTTVRLYLPRAGGRPGGGASAGVEGTQLPRGSETILVVDDEAALAEVAVAALESMGYSTLSASNGREALAIVRDTPSIDLLFSDVIMPGDMDGYLLAIEALKVRPGLKVLLTSGYTRRHEEFVNGERAVATEMVKDLLPKPYNIAELARAVRRMLDR